MSGLKLRVILAAVSLGVVLGLAEQACAVIYNFDDEYYISSSSMFTTRFGAPGTGAYSSAGIYQLTKSTSPTIVTRLGSATAIPGEYEQNTTPNANNFLALTGWGQSLNNGNQVASVYNLNNPINGTVEPAAVFDGVVVVDGRGNKRDRSDSDKIGKACWSLAMPRTASVAPGGMAFHVLNRGIARMQVFEKAGDYETFERTDRS
jgi:hypothetical protein